MDNFAKWQEITSGLCSPESYIRWGFYYLIGASLQRRVWLGNSRPLYPNTYVVFVGEPGIGKGLVIGPVNEFLREHQLRSDSFNSAAVTSAADLDAAKLLAERDVNDAQKANIAGGGTAVNLLIPVAANAITYEALVGAMCTGKRRINRVVYDEKLGKNKMEIYTHHSIAFCLTEMASLFKKKSENVVNFLLDGYDCIPYEYETIKRQKECIPRTCINLLGGCTPDFMQDTFDEHIIGGGFSARTFFIYAAKNRKNVMFIPDLTPEQLSYKRDISAHILALSKLVGEVHIDQSVKDKLSKWWDDDQNGVIKRSNTSAKLKNYYGRKNIHVQKLAMAYHFSNSLDMKMGWEPFEWAIAMLHAEEANMHHALILDGNNPMHKIARKVENYILLNGPVTLRELFVTFYEEFVGKKEDLDIVLGDLLTLGKISSNRAKDETTGEYQQVYAKV